MMQQRPVAATSLSCRAVTQPGYSIRNLPAGVYDCISAGKQCTVKGRHPTNLNNSCRWRSPRPTAATSCFSVVPTCPTANVSFTVNGCVATRPLVLCNAFICVSFPIQLRLIFWRYLPLEGGPALNRGRPSIRQPCPSPLNRQSFHRVGRKPARKS